MKISIGLIKIFLNDENDFKKNDKSNKNKGNNSLIKGMIKIIIKILMTY